LLNIALLQIGEFVDNSSSSFDNQLIAASFPSYLLVICQYWGFTTRLFAIDNPAPNRPIAPPQEMAHHRQGGVTLRGGFSVANRTSRSLTQATGLRAARSTSN
jgi:hypothetical protein